MENCIQIGRGDLKVWVGKPGLRYARSRFDWTGFIPQVSLRGHTFCTPESPTPGRGSGGEGICDEFRISEAAMAWDDTDRFFLKPGVGKLERIDEKPYHFGANYPVVQAFPCTVNAGADYVDIHLDAIPLKGLAFTQDKHICVMDNMLLITTTITNVGEKKLDFREYNHNFLSMDSLGAHPQASLTLHKNYENKSDNSQGLIQNEESIGFTEEFQTGNGYMIYCQEPIAYSPMRWELRDEKAGLSVQEWGDFDVTDFLAWGGKHVISPEIYGDFPVEPGQARTWTRMWKFFAP
jgi:hypothetical protein